MTRLHDYQSALQCACPDISGAVLENALEAAGPEFVSFVVALGLGPLWHERTGRDEFRQSRFAAEALFTAQEDALGELDIALTNAGVKYVVIKGAANRLLLYENPALRYCCDLDLLVRPADRAVAATELAKIGFSPVIDASSVSSELLLTRDVVDIDLHWGLLREGRLRRDCTGDIIDRGRRVHGVWMPSSEDTFFMLVVHPAFRKHLSSSEMGLNRVADILEWIATQEFNWPRVHRELEACGVVCAAWATLQWVRLLAGALAPTQLESMILDTQPGRLRRAWLNSWLQNDLSARTSELHLLRLIGFSLFLHDAPTDVWRAVTERSRARSRHTADRELFSGIQNQAER